MTATDHAHPQPRRLPPLYVMFWGFLATMALAYLLILLTRPDFATALLPSAESTALAHNDPALARVVSDVGGIKKSVTTLQKDLGEVRTAFGVQDERIQMLTSRVASLETSPRPPMAEHDTAPPVPLSGVSAAPPPPPALDPPVPVSLSAQTEAPATQIVTGALVGPPARKPATPDAKPTPPDLKPTTPDMQPTVAAPAASTPPATPAAAPAPVASGWATSSKATKSAPVAIQLSTGPSLDSLRLSWQLLTEENRATLKTLLPRYVEIGADPSTYALIAGPIASRDEAQKTCARLKARRVTCTISAYEGDPL